MAMSPLLSHKYTELEFCHIWACIYPYGGLNIRLKYFFKFLVAIIDFAYAFIHHAPFFKMANEISQNAIAQV